MDWNLLLEISEKGISGRKLAPEEKQFVAKTVPAALAEFPTIAYPTSLRHPAGFKVTGAVVRTFSKCALVIAGRAALGPRYGGGSAFYDHVESMLALEIMRAHFVHGAPRGTFCCPPCTLAVYPLLEAGLIRWFDGRSLAPAVRALIGARGWRFAGFRNTAMIAWALGESSDARSAIR